MDHKREHRTPPLARVMGVVDNNNIYTTCYTKKIKQACIEAKEAWLNEQCQLIEQLDSAHKTNLMHCRIKEVTGKKRGNGTTTCVEAKDGTIIMEKDKILDR